MQALWGLEKIHFCVMLKDMAKSVKVAKLNRNNNHKHSDKRKHARHKDGR